MEKERVKAYIEDWYKRELPPLIERELKVTSIRRKVTSVVGPRRSGKTYFFFQLMKPVKTQSLYLDFEDSSLANIRFDEILDVINLFIEITGKKPLNIFLDEVQRVEKWETMVRTLLDRGDYNVFIAGSSSKLLGKEIATQLRGRALTYFLFGFSFREFLRAKGEKTEEILTQAEKARIKNLLKEYLEHGSYPEVVLMPEKERILKDYCDTIFFKDFVERHKLKSIDVARFLFSYVLQNFSKEISINKVFNFLKSQSLRLGKNTVYEYVEKLQDTLSVFFVKRYSPKIYVREAWPRKVYVCDTGISKIMRISKDIGKLMENVVFLELLRKINLNPLLEIFYWKDYQFEVDFVLKEGMKIKQLIQVTYVSSKDEIGKREIKALLKASEELKCNNLLVITWDYEAREKINTKEIKFVPLWKWLLEMF